jgi:hypothetical protein
MRQPRTGKANGTEKRKYLSQTDVPMYSLEQAARVPRAIVDEHAGKATRPLDVAHAMKVQPGSGPFRSLCGASIAYGLTAGGYNADAITLEELGRRVVNKTAEDPEGLLARREATLRPRIVREFLQKYDGSKMPREDVALKVLQGLGVPQDALKRVYDLITEAARIAKFFKEINGVQYVDLKQTPVSTAPAPLIEDEEAERHVVPEEPLPPALPRVTAPTDEPPKSDPREGRVFVTHGKNRDLIPQLKELLEFGELYPVVSIERESVSQPVPDKVMADMRSCGAAVIHVDANKEVMTKEGEKEAILNGNVLIEIGAAMALYGRRFILLVHDGIRLPSNLQGLYEVRYSGQKLDGDATLRLLKTFSELKKLRLEKVG